MELTFTRVTDSGNNQFSLEKPIVEKASTEWTNLNSRVQRLPMAVDRLQGQYLAGPSDHSALVTPDSSVFTSNYPS